MLALRWGGGEVTQRDYKRIGRLISRIQPGKKRGAYKGSERTCYRLCAICGRRFRVKFPCVEKKNCSRSCKGMFLSIQQLGRVRHTYGVAI